ncbi:MAG: bifunctional alpha,alpha-trehalose-phosphate synthase (UDP-forming)/trehalose-phosphatase [Thermodesulfovibrionales bacterium]|jgi:alpha,alpha-trehalose-phosphate synthase [UDP-forming]/trehalose-phosphatase|nr:bifunctional alpha,alpha-trehalose-phosphate synthase (UDP-forming)/trehalose-phosphatase [Thermodesulfovibrionales bacterium]
MLKAFIEENLSDKNLIVVSNREPYIHKKTGLSIRVEKPAGGLTSAMDDVLKVTGGTWVAWGSGGGDRDVVDSKNLVLVPPENPSYMLKRVWLSQSEAENYYHGYSNQVLWPLCHITLDRVYFRKKFWEDYKKANRAFSDAVLEEADNNSVVWVHDYHLCLVPGMLRNERPELTIAHFWHIPWPDWSVFRICPQAKEIIVGLLGNDLVGFQIPLFVKNFMDCVSECLDADIDYSRATINFRGHITRLKAFPISIDFDKFNSMASSQRTIRMMENIKEKHGVTQGYIGIGVDRLEYTKALIKRLQAIDLFFDRYERFRRRFTFIQIAIPTRMREPYISYKKAVEELVSKINEKYSVGNWKPIIYIDTKVEHKDLVSYYRAADVAIISSVYDGMNLVAKEYVASKTDEKGVLILSEFAGASEELEGSILVNPYDIEQFSECIKTALKMPEKEKVSRMVALRRHVSENNIHKWILDILNEITAIAAVKSEKCCYLFDNFGEIKKRVFNKDIFLSLDYDGTLTPIVEAPDKAVISDEMRSLIIKLKEHIPVAVISGRALQNVKDRVGIEDIIYAGNHGAEIWDGKKAIISQGSEENRRLLEEVLEKLKKETSYINGVLIEDKGITASLHFRNVNVRQVGDIFRIFDKIAKEYEDDFRFIIGKKVFEIRPVNIWNKGDAVSWIIENMGEGRFPVYIGDDTTDEDAYRILKDRGLSISIGGSASADYYIQNQGEVRDFLMMLYEGLNK